MFFGHEGLEIGGGYVFRTTLKLAPFHEQAVGDAPVDSEDQHPFVALHPRAIVIVGNIQSLVKATLDAPALAVEVQPSCGIEPVSGGTGDQSHFFVLAAFGLSQQPRRLGGKRKSYVLSGDGGGANDTVFRPSLVLLLRAGLRRRGMFRGENPLGQRLLFSEGWPREWAGSSCR